ncbi:MAG: SusE domain-containing protein [Chitinophagia bacterium]
MKTIINKILLLVTLGVVLISCKKEGQLVTLGNGVPGVLTTSVSTVVLTKPNLNVEAVKASFTAADFGYSAAATNVLQIAKAGTSFTNAKEIILEAGLTSKSLTHLELNDILLAMNLVPEVAANVDFRVKSTIASSVASVYTNVKTISVTPFALKGTLYMPGAYNGWDPTTADSLVSPTGDGVYKGVILFTGAGQEYKLLKKKSWGSPEYGSGASAGSIAVGGGNLVGPTAFTTDGTTYSKESFLVTADLNINTVVYELQSWGLIGSATPGGWGSDQPMKCNNTNGKWSITVSLVAGDVKFRKNHNWGTNLGGASGVLSDGGANIAVAADGSYTFVLDPIAKTYTMTKN